MSNVRKYSIYSRWRLLFQNIFSRGRMNIKSSLILNKTNFSWKLAAVMIHHDWQEETA